MINAFRLTIHVDVKPNLKNGSKNMLKFQMFFVCMLVFLISYHVQNSGSIVLISQQFPQFLVDFCLYSLIIDFHCTFCKVDIFQSNLPSFCK